MTTAAFVFDSAMALMDEFDPDSGLADPFATKDYRVRTLHILSILCGELYHFSDNCETPVTGARPICNPPFSLSDDLPLDDFLARSILPYGLAAHLLVDENPAAAAFFQQRYQELISKFGSAAPAVPIPITDLYGGVTSPSSSG